MRLRLVFIGDVSGIGIDECRYASLHLNLPVAYFSRSVIKFFICDASWLRVWFPQFSPLLIIFFACHFPSSILHIPIGFIVLLLRYDNSFIGRQKKIVTFHNICFYHKHILITHFSHSQTRAAADQTPAAIHLPLKKKTQTPSQSATRRMKTKTFSSRTTGSKTSKTSPPPELVSRLPDALQEINRRLTGQNLMWWTVRWMQ